MLKMYRKCTNALFALFLMIEMLKTVKHDTLNFNRKRNFLFVSEIYYYALTNNIYKMFSLGQVAKTNLQNF